MTFQECEDYILSVPKFAGKLGTEELSKILELMGHPERDCPVIHVAGTNGKGSTCSFLASILRQAGKRVGVFTSPHLIKITERIRIGEKLISEEDFTACFEETMEYVKQAKEKGISHPSFFELLFLMAALYFRKQKTEYVIYETGMGGRLDATNVVSPEVCVITSVGMDHMQYLGNTLSQIAGEKAGIIKRGVPVVFFDRKDESTNVIKQTAKKLNAPFFSVEKSQYKLLKIANKVIDFSFNSGYYRYCQLSIRQTGLYQIENAMLAVKAFELIRNSLDSGCGRSSDSAIREQEMDWIRAGLLSMVWPGRMEQIADRVFIDGAHNEEAIEAFCHTLEVLFPSEQKRLLFAVSEDKDYETMIGRLCRIPFAEVILVRYEGSRAAELDTVAEVFRHFSGSRITAFDDLRVGFSYGMSHVEDSYLFCVGSLYLAGDLLRVGRNDHDKF